METSIPSRQSIAKEAVAVLDAAEVEVGVTDGEVDRASASPFAPGSVVELPLVLVLCDVLG